MNNFTNGNSVLFMDPYDVYYPVRRTSRNMLAATPVNGICSAPLGWDNMRKNLGYTRVLDADRMVLWR